MRQKCIVCRKKSYKTNKEYHKIKNREYYNKNKKDILKKSKKYRQKNKNIILKKQKTWRENNKSKILKQNSIYVSKRRQNDPGFRILMNTRSRIGNAIKKNKKLNKTINLLGCSIEEFKLYIESKFQKDMSWKNYGRKGWHIDHIIPCSSFDLNNIEEQKRCFHYSNLQPLWAEDNLRKSNKIL